MKSFSLKQLGFDNYFESQLEDNHLKVGRISFAANERYRILSTNGEIYGTILGKLRYYAESSRDLPSVGDWVLFEQIGEDNLGVVHKILQRKSLLSRKIAGDKQVEQIIAANVDIVFLVNALNNDFNLRRMERYLYVVYESGAVPVFVLTKKDLGEDVEAKVAGVEAIAPGVPIVTVNSLTGEGYKNLVSLLSEGKTYSLIGSSGVGKSTIINRLFQSDIQKTKEVREVDDKGKHTTTHRELFVLPEGGVLIDTPGMRELQLWGYEDSIQQTFEDIEEISKQCQFSDCKHEAEPNCAIQDAIGKGVITQERLDNYRKLQRELRRLELKDKYGGHRASKMQWKEFKKRNKSK